MQVRKGKGSVRRMGVSRAASKAKAGSTGESLSRCDEGQLHRRFSQANCYPQTRNGFEVSPEPSRKESLNSSLGAIKGVCVSGGDECVNVGCM